MTSKKDNIPLIFDGDEKEERKDLDYIRNYKEYLPFVEKLLEKTDMPYAPWTIVEANDRSFATLKIMMTSIHAIETSIEHATRTPAQQTLRYLDIEAQKIPQLNNFILEMLTFQERWMTMSTRNQKSFTSKSLQPSNMSCLRKKRPLVVVFEGWDAAGKGGDIYRLAETLIPGSTE